MVAQILVHIFIYRNYALVRKYHFINLFLFFFVLLLSVCAAVKIKKFNVPSAHILHNEDNPEEFILDCEYEIDPTEKGFVLKWLLNDSQIYQWIPNQAHPHTFVSHHQLNIYNFFFLLTTIQFMIFFLLYFFFLLNPVVIYAQLH